MNPSNCFCKWNKNWFHGITTGLTFISLVANFKTLLTILRESFLFGFFSIFRYKLICDREPLLYITAKDNPFIPELKTLWASWWSNVFYLLSEQHWGVAVLAVRLRAERRQPQQEEDEGRGPHHQLPVCRRLQKCFVAVQELSRRGGGGSKKHNFIYNHCTGKTEQFLQHLLSKGCKIISTQVIWSDGAEVFTTFRSFYQTGRY